MRVSPPWALSLSCLVAVGALGVAACVPAPTSTANAANAANAAVASVAAPITIRVDTRAAGTAVNPHLYGVFFEEINHAGDGGLYAELIRNRSFEDRPELDSWNLYADTGAEVKLASDTTKPVHAKNPTALRLEVAAATSSGKAGVVNPGYWGIPVEKGGKYRLSLHARRDDRFGRQGRLTARLESADGKTIYAEEKLPSLASDWKEHTLTLTARASDPKARLAILSDHPGTVWLDMVSLFPADTFKKRPNGLRPDLAQMVADLKPAFFRFPGGCFVEGERMDQAYRWKDTIGSLETRPGRACLWGYRSTEGLGYHEYLQFCEDIGADPLVVVNCGMAHRDHVPMDQLQPWVQDALDAIEYAVGPETSPWGKLRAQNGHPKPFRLPYLEIGNENGGPLYNERYAVFYDAVKKRYPDVRIIANVWGGTPTSRPADIIDEHYYNNPAWFFANANRYDTYSRSGPKIFVGEYAVTSGAGQGNLHAALSEAAFMLGMERNSDIVSLAAYAPLFVHVQDRKWNPDAIAFDGTRVYGTPSYHIQKLFSLNRPDFALPTVVTMDDATRAATTSAIAPREGSVGVGTWLTQAEFKEIKISEEGGRVTGQEQLTSRQTRGAWQTLDGAYRQTDNGEDNRLILSAASNPQSWSNYELTLKARKLSGAEGFLILFHVRDDRNLYWWNIGGWGNSRHAVERMVDGQKSTIGGEKNGSIETNRWYDIKVSVRGPQVRCYLDGVLIHEFEDKGASVFHALGGKTRNEYILKVVNGSEQPQMAQVVLAGIPVPRSASLPAEVTTLTGPTLNAENSLDSPDAIAPKTERRELTVTSSQDGPLLSYTFPPRSVTVLKLKQ